MYQPRSGRAAYAKPNRLASALSSGLAAVVEHVRRQPALVGGAQRGDVSPAVSEQFDRLAAGGQEHVDRRVPIWPPRLHDLAVLGQVEPRAVAVREQRDEEGHRPQDHERRVQQEPGRSHEQPDLAVHQRREGEHGAERQHPGMPPDVSELLRVGRRHRKDQVPGLLAFPPGVPRRAPTPLRSRLGPSSPVLAQPPARPPSLVLMSTPASAGRLARAAGRTRARHRPETGIGCDSRRGIGCGSRCDDGDMANFHDLLLQYVQLAALRPPEIDHRGGYRFLSVCMSILSVCMSTRSRWNFSEMCTSGDKTGRSPVRTAHRTSN